MADEVSLATSWFGKRLWMNLNGSDNWKREVEEVDEDIDGRDEWDDVDEDEDKTDELRRVGDEDDDDELDMDDDADDADDWGDSLDLLTFVLPPTLPFEVRRNVVVADVVLVCGWDLPSMRLEALAAGVDFNSLLDDVDGKWLMIISTLF